MIFEIYWECNYDCLFNKAILALNYDREQEMKPARIEPRLSAGALFLNSSRILSVGPHTWEWREQEKCWGVTLQPWKITTQSAVSWFFTAPATDMEGATLLQEGKLCRPLSLLQIHRITSISLSVWQPFSKKYMEMSCIIRYYWLRSTISWYCKMDQTI